MCELLSRPKGLGFPAASSFLRRHSPLESGRVLWEFSVSVSLAQTYISGDKGAPEKERFEGRNHMIKSLLSCWMPLRLRGRLRFHPLPEDQGLLALPPSLPQVKRLPEKAQYSVTRVAAT
jgi:hypothetical protein